MELTDPSHTSTELSSFPSSILPYISLQPFSHSVLSNVGIIAFTDGKCFGLVRNRPKRPGR
jgi:hypothetical protein